MAKLLIKPIRGDVRSFVKEDIIGLIGLHRFAREADLRLVLISRLP